VPTEAPAETLATTPEAVHEEMEVTTTGSPEPATTALPTTTTALPKTKAEASIQVTTGAPEEEGTTSPAPPADVGSVDLGFSLRHFDTAALEQPGLPGGPTLRVAIEEEVSGILAEAGGVGADAVKISIRKDVEGASLDMHARVTLDALWVGKHPGAVDEVLERLNEISSDDIAVALCKMKHGIKNAYYYSRQILKAASEFTNGNTSFLDRKDNLPCPFRVVDFVVNFAEPGTSGASILGAEDDSSIGHTCPMADVNPSMSGSFCFYRARADAPFQLAHWQSLDANNREKHYAVPCSSDACCDSLKMATGQCCGEESTLWEVACMVGTITSQSLEGNSGLGVAFGKDLGEAFPSVQQRCKFAGASYSCPGTWIPKGDGHHGHPPPNALGEPRRTVAENRTAEQRGIRKDAAFPSVSAAEGAFSWLW
jgi:hypothetical protein